MGRVLLAASAAVLFVLACVLTLATTEADRLVTALSTAGLACLAAAFVIHVSDPRR